MASQTHSQVLRRSLQLHIDSSYKTGKALGSSHTPTPSLNVNMSELEGNVDSYYRGYTDPSNSTLFSALCMYDFSSNDSGLLSFAKNEILDIVKCDDTGWWAAMRKDGPVVGWIPQAFVVRLSDDMAERLRDVHEDIRVYEYEAEQLYASAPVSRLPDVFDIYSVAPSPLPLYEERRTPSLHRKRSANDCLRPGTGRPMPPPSPTSPMPHPPTLLPSKVKYRLPPTGGEAAPAPRQPARTSSINHTNQARPVDLEAGETLVRMSTLVESKEAREFDRLARLNFSSSLGKKSRDKLNRKQGCKDVRRTDSVILIRPWYLQPQLAEQIEVDSKGHIINATLPALIERLTTHDAPVALTRQAEFTTFTAVFLTTFRTFTTANVLFEILTSRYNARPANTLSGEEIDDWKMNWLSPTRKRILQIFNIWLEDHRLLEEEPHLAKPLTDFLRTITIPPHNTDAEAIVKTLERLTFTVPLDSSTHNTPRKPKRSKVPKSDLMKVDPANMAEQLTLWEQSFYVKVTTQDCLAYARVKTGPGVAKLVAFCATYDNLVSWVKGSVLNHEVLGKRAYTVDFWIKVAEKCRSLNNIASMSAIISALSSAAITNLHLTWAHVNRRAALEALSHYNEPNGGFARYRNLLRDAEGPCVPFITMYLSDIIHAEEHFAYQDTGGRICFYKRARWYETINNILKFAKRPYNIPLDETMKHFIEVQLLAASEHDSDWFWTKSHEVQRTEVAHADIRKGLEAAGF